MNQGSRTPASHSSAITGWIDCVCVLNVRGDYVGLTLLRLAYKFQSHNVACLKCGRKKTRKTGKRVCVLVGVKEWRQMGKHERKRLREIRRRERKSPYATLGVIPNPCILLQSLFSCDSSLSCHFINVIACYYLYWTEADIKKKKAVFCINCSSISVCIKILKRQPVGFCLLL